jgi:hypothetical protein
MIGPRIGIPAPTIEMGIQDQTPPELDEEYARWWRTMGAR